MFLTPPDDPVVRCEVCRVGLRARDVAGTAPGDRYYCPDHNTSRRSVVSDHTVPVEAVRMPPDLSKEDLPRCARCREPQLFLVEDPHFGTRASVCADCYEEYGGDPTTGTVVIEDVVADLGVDPADLARS